MKPFPECIEGNGLFFATPTVSKHRLFVWLQQPILPDHQLIVFARDDDYVFGVLHSKVHELWARRMGTQLREAESGFRYTPTTCFETFPMPWVLGQEPQTTVAYSTLRPLVRRRYTYSRHLQQRMRQRGKHLSRRERQALRKRHYRLLPNSTRHAIAHKLRIRQRIKEPVLVSAIAQAARELVAQREAWLHPPTLPTDALKKRTLTRLYNMRPDWLTEAHRKLDVAVLRSYGWPPDIGDEDILAHLLALNAERRML